MFSDEVVTDNLWMIVLIGHCDRPLHRCALSYCSPPWSRHECCEQQQTQQIGVRGGRRETGPSSATEVGRSGWLDTVGVVGGR